jgi:hypothetical protein
LTVGAVLALSAMFVTPVLAISSISNTFTMSPQTFGDAKTVTVDAKTKYDQFWIPPNPYPSNFAVAVGYRHLRSPSIVLRTGVAGSYVYKASIDQINGGAPGYWYDNGGGWFFAPVTYELKATFKSVSSCSFKKIEHWHGQSDLYFNSSGPAVTLVSTHTSC